MKLKPSELFCMKTAFSEAIEREKLAITDDIFNKSVNGYKALLQTKDIKLLEGKLNLTPKELAIIRHKGLKETHIQQRACAMTKQLALTLKPKQRLKFVQIDNGGNLSIAGKVRKKKEGTYANMADVFILASNGSAAKLWAVEFKRIGSKSQIVGDKVHFEGQLAELRELNYMGFSAHMTNNLLYFEYVVLEEIKGFFNLK